MCVRERRERTSGWANTWAIDKAAASKVSKFGGKSKKSKQNKDLRVGEHVGNDNAVFVIIIAPIKRRDRAVRTLRHHHLRGGKKEREKLVIT